MRKTAVWKTAVWIVNIAMTAAVVALAFMVITNNHDEGKAAAAKGGTTTTTAKPPPSHEFVAEGPNAEKLRRLVADLDLSAFVDDDDYNDWQVGIVGDIKGNTFSMVTGAYTDVFYESGGCDDGRGMPDEYIPTLLDPGDIILWDTRGDDHNFCLGEIMLVKER